MLASCGGSAEGGKRSPQDLAIQRADVTGLSRCSQSGSPDAVVQTLRQSGNSADADHLAGYWADDRARGGHEAYLVGYAASPGDCLRILGAFGTGAIRSLQTRWVVNYVVAFPGSPQAKAAWADRATYLQNFSYTAGKTTGLGDNSIVLDGYQPQWYAVWSKGSSYAVLATNSDASIATRLASQVAARM